MFIKWAATLTEWVSDQWVKPIGESTYQVLTNRKTDSPSFSGGIASASHNMNGWNIFKDNENKTLDEVYRG